MGVSLEQCGQANCLELTEKNVIVIGQAEKISNVEISLGLHIKVGQAPSLVEQCSEGISDSVSWSTKVYFNQDDQQLIYEGFEAETSIANLLLESITFDLSELLAPGLLSVRDLESRLEQLVLGKLLKDWYIKAFLTRGPNAAQHLEVTFSSSKGGRVCSFLRFTLKPVVHQGQYDPVAVADYRY